MRVSKCKNCPKPIFLDTGRRPREYCDDNCRKAYYKRNRKPTPVKEKILDKIAAPIIIAPVIERNEGESMIDFLLRRSKG